MKPAGPLSSPHPFRAIDWALFCSILPLLSAGLVTMRSFTEPNDFFSRQLVWIAVSFALFFTASFIDWRFLRRSDVLFLLFAAICALLSGLFLLGKIRGVHGWFTFGLFSFQPVEPAKLVLVLVLAKYFSRRHIEIANIRHILVSGFYAFVLFSLVLLQPDFGGAMVIFLIWFCMVLLSGISKKHLLAVFLVGALSLGLLWANLFKDYQKQRVVTFLHPLADIKGSGYNAYQSMIAVGSGGLFGKGVGLGSQSRLKFLPQYETDFIFAAFAEEWGFVGVLLLFFFYALLLYRILSNALHGRSNFEMLFALGLAIFIMSHVLIHVGMNLGLLPVTGITLPFISYGGTHVTTLYLGLGVLMGMRRYRRAAHRELMQNEFVGVTSGESYTPRESSGA